MQTIKIKAYTINELSKEAQEEAINGMANINVYYEDWHDFIIEEWQGQLEALGYTNAEIKYNGFWSQGDGACFTATVDIEKWIKVHKAGRRFAKLLTEVKAGYWATITITHSWKYYYSTSTTVNYEGQSDLSDRAYGQLEEMANWIEEEREGLGNKIYRELEKAYDSLTTKEAVKETIEANDYLFTEDGSRKVYL